ncbi:ufm1-specific protease 1 isoform X1 [Schistocerca nitens]|uniref:ufm1-specific protease 1 isoform X1 n=1 Tax=Schistocerca nitens TaxID=7011 RepID=UPI002118348F|nr:ufm1-specific protease 1 isoform X1 [Schistocerca nitens]
MSSVLSRKMPPKDYRDRLLSDVHVGLKNVTDCGTINYVKGTYDYYHYGCDGFSDKGWGCGYRTLQTLCSWVKESLKGNGSPPPVPHIREIQSVLVGIEDKPTHFIGSRDWIGCFEACLVLDVLYSVSCKVIHIPSGQQLCKHIPELVEHFSQLGSPVMMGGDKDCSAKCIVGVHTDVERNEASLLVVDPHFWGVAADRYQLQREGWVCWKQLSEFLDSSFYNLCLPQLSSELEPSV